MTTIEKTEEFRDVALKTTKEFLDKATYYSGAMAGFIVRGCRKLRDSNLFSGRGNLRIVHLLKNKDAVDEPQKKEIYQSLGRDLVKLLKEDTGSRDLSMIDISLYEL